MEMVEEIDAIYQYVKDDDENDYIKYGRFFSVIILTIALTVLVFSSSFFFLYEYCRVIYLLSQYHNRYILLRRYVKRDGMTTRK